MTKTAGVPTRTRFISKALNNLRTTVPLSKTAKLRLSWMDYHRTHGANASMTCRHFGLSRSCFHKWRKRFRAYGPRGLENLSTRPKHVRHSTLPGAVVDTVRTLRRANPELSKYKLAVILKRDHGYSLSASTVGRILTRYNLFFTPRIKPKRHPQRLKNTARMRKPRQLAVLRPGELIEVDVKHLPNNGRKRYGFVAIDVVSKQATIHVASTISSHQAAIAWAKTVARLGLPSAVLSDNGSENLGEFAVLVAEQQVTHYLAHPYTPKDKSHVERFIGSLEKECIQWSEVADALADQQELIDAWLQKYHTYRP